METKVSSAAILLLLLLLLSRKPFSEVCPNYEVVMFQYQKGNPPDVGSIANFLVAIIL